MRCLRVGHPLKGPARGANMCQEYSHQPRGYGKDRFCEYPANLVEWGGHEPKKLEVSLRLLSPLGSIRTSPGGP